MWHGKGVKRQRQAPWVENQICIEEGFFLTSQKLSGILGVPELYVNIVAGSGRVPKNIGLEDVDDGGEGRHKRQQDDDDE